MHSVATFRKMQQDSDVRPDWNEVGSLRIALSDRRATELRELESIAKTAGLEAGLISIEAKRCRWPPMDFSAVKAVLWCPSDGYMTPYCVAKAYEHQCRKMGVRFAISTSVEAIACKNGRVEGVKTNRGMMSAKYVVNAAGAHAYHIAKLVGLELPIIPVRHEYFVTVGLPGLDPALPCFRVPEQTLYGRASGDKLLLGGWEADPLSTSPRGFGLEQSAPPIEPDW